MRRGTSGSWEPWRRRWYESRANTTVSALHFNGAQAAHAQRGGLIDAPAGDGVGHFAFVDQLTPWAVLAVTGDTTTVTASVRRRPFAAIGADGLLAHRGASAGAVTVM